MSVSLLKNRGDFLMLYYKNSRGEYTERSFPLLLDDEAEISESEYNEYMESENMKWSEI